MCARSRCAGHATLQLAAVCSTIQQLTAAKMAYVDSIANDMRNCIDAAAAACSNQPKRTPAPVPLSACDLKSSAASAQVSVDEFCHDERCDIAICARDALNLVLTSLEVAADGDTGASAGLAPALLQAVRSVRSLGRMQLTLTVAGRADVGTVLMTRLPAQDENLLQIRRC